MISIIVPAKDASKTLGDCLDALLHQEGMQFGIDYEIIVVDDGSTDNTAEIARRYKVNVITQSNMGPGAARNAGSIVAQGSLLVFTDADCAPSSNWLVAITRPLSYPEVIGVKGTYLTRQPELVARFVQLEYEYKYTRMLRHNSIDFIDTYSAAYRTDVFEQNNGFNQTFRVLEDQEFSSRLARKGYRMVFEPSATVFHLHSRTLAEYIRKKFRIGYWKALVLRSIPEKAFTDSHTAPTQRVEILLLACLLATLPFIGFWPFWSSIAFLGFLAIFLVITTPFMTFVHKRDPNILWITPWMLLCRAGALGLGLLKGFFLSFSNKPKGYPCQSMSVRVCKRLIDIIAGFIGLILASPVMLLAAIAIRLDSRGSVIYKQPRAGEFGKPFIIYKLRTMVIGADQMVTEIASLSHLKGPAFKIPDDPRVTRMGRVLRRWSLDELPQFWNVLKGDMSLVGPRPEVLQLVEQYTDDQRQRLIVKPGLTGPVQVSGRGEMDFDQSFQLEMDYLKHYTVFEDLKIMFKTIPAILSGKGIT